MTINWGTPARPKYINFLYGKDWDKEEIKLFKFRKTPLGWDITIRRFNISYDNFGNVKA